MVCSFKLVTSTFSPSRGTSTLASTVQEISKADGFFTLNNAVWCHSESDQDSLGVGEFIVIDGKVDSTGVIVG